MLVLFDETHTVFQKVLIHVLYANWILITLLFWDLDQLFKGVIRVFVLENGAAEGILNHIALEEINKALVTLDNLL